jgi:hypothetical protein
MLVCTDLNHFFIYLFEKLFFETRSHCVAYIGLKFLGSQLPSAVWLSSHASMLA